MYAVHLDYVMSVAYGETQLSLAHQALTNTVIEQAEDATSVRDKNRTEYLEYHREMVAMGYHTRKGNSKSKATMLRKRGYV